jgi:ribosomal protein S18 acetylase RimI-like enzyme
MSDEIYQVRPADYDDIKVLITLLKELFHIETDFSFNAKKQRAGLRRLLHEHNAVILVAQRETLIVGMCTVQTVISTAEGGRAGLLEDMIVHDKFRRQGIGKQLLAAAEKWAAVHELSRLTLLADIINEPALKFYESQGWQKTNMVCLRKQITPPQ